MTDEGGDYRWFYPEQLPEPVFIGIVRFVNNLAATTTYGMSRQQSSHDQEYVASISNHIKS